MKLSKLTKCHGNIVNTEHVRISKREQTKTVILYFIDKTTDGDLVNSRQLGANLLECQGTLCISRMVLQFIIYKTIIV